MSRARESNALIGALLDRLDSVQAQALLARLDRWLIHEREKLHTPGTPIDRNQGPSSPSPYDRRRRDANGNESYEHQSNAAS